MLIYEINKYIFQVQVAEKIRKIHTLICLLSHLHIHCANDLYLIYLRFFYYIFVYCLGLSNESYDFKTFKKRF